MPESTPKPDPTAAGGPPRIDAPGTAAATTAVTSAPSTEAPPPRGPSTEAASTEAASTEAASTEAVSTGAASTEAVSTEAAPFDASGDAPDPAAIPLMRKDFDALSTVVLDAADVASKAAEAAVTAGTRFRSTVDDLAFLGRALDRRAWLGLGVVSALMLLSLVVFAAMAARVASKMNTLDATTLAVGKRAVELDAGLKGLAEIRQEFGALTAKQEEIVRAQSDLKAKLETALQHSASPVAQAPKQAAKEAAKEASKEVSTTSDAIARQLQGIDAKLQAQAGAVASLDRQMQSLREAVSGVPEMGREIESLVELQRERQQDPSQKQSVVRTARPPPPPPPAKREPVPQYPQKAAPQGTERLVVPVKP